MKKAICFIASAVIIGFGCEYGNAPLIFGGTAGSICTVIWLFAG